MVFSIGSLKRNKSKYIDISDSSCSYFEESLNIILSEQEKFTTITNQNMFNFNSNNIDFIDFHIFENIFKWFNESLESITSKFFNSIDNISANNEFKKYRKKIDSYRGIIKYNKKYREYKNIDINTSYTSYQTEIEKEYNDIISNLEKIKLSNSIYEINGIISNMKTKTLPTTIEGELNSIRGKVLSNSSPITINNFSDILFNYYRGDIIRGIEIESEKINQICKDYYGNMKYRVRRDKNNLKIESNKQKILFSEINPRDFISENKTDDKFIFDYNNIINQKYKKIKSICDIYLMVFSAKLDALEEYYSLNKDILSVLVKQIIREEEL